MKPAFALDFRNDAIALLHRTTGGWHQVGRVTFDDPDLPSALGYLRSTALGLSPRGLATKLILPDEQILYTTVDAPGPDDASRAAQIRAALEGRTPYAVEDLIFDWEEAQGEVRVAVIARETLAEAEGFAVEHRFNPVSFVAAPATGFAGEPWFGQTAHALSLLAEGETVERDGAPVALAARPGAEVTQAAEQDLPVAEPVAAGMAASEDPAAEVEVAEVEEPAGLPLGDSAAAEADWQAEPAFEPQPEPAPAPEPEAEVEVEAEAAPEVEAAVETGPDMTPAFETGFADDPALGPADDDLPDLPPAPREQPLFGLADDEPPPSQAFRAPPAKPKEPRVKERRGQDFWGAPQSTRPEPMRPEPTRPEPTRLEPMRPEVSAPPPLDRSAFTAPEPAVASRPAPAAMQDRPAADPDLEAPMALDVEEEDPAAASRPVGVTDRSLPADDLPDDVPPVPGYSPAMGFASRRASAADPATAPKLAAPPRPTVARPAAARPAPPAAPKAERPLVDRPTAVNPNAARENKGLRGLGAFVTAPGLPGTRKKKVEAQPAPATGPSETAPPPAGKRAASLEKGIGAGRTPVRGKPRYLGLILTAVLLLVLAVIAAWSTSLAFRGDDGGETELASALPAPEEEMMADGVLPDAAANGDAAGAETGAVEAVTETETAAAAADTGTDAALGAPEEGASGLVNDIVLAAKDPSPDLPDPLAQPEATAQGDPLPAAQAPPPPFGTVYQFDAKGLIVPTPEGIVTPEGVLLVAGKPPRVPPARPADLAPAVPAPDPAAAPADGAAAQQTVADPALAGFRPKARPEGLTPPIELNAAPT
ncbi:MAG: hypothetical protein E6Q73_02870, partial [Pseudorhodobacter sp.]